MLSQDLIFSATGVLLFGLGLYGLLLMPHILRKLIAVNILGIGVFMLLLGTSGHGSIVDPVPHAMVLTGIVVAVAGTALCLWLAVAIAQLDSTARGESE